MWVRFSALSYWNKIISFVICNWTCKRWERRNIALTASWEGDGFFENDSIQNWDYGEAAESIPLLSHCFTVNSLFWHLKSVSHSSFSWILGFQKWLGRRKINLGVPAFLRKCYGPSLQNSSEVLQVQQVKICGPLKIMVQRFPVKAGNMLSLGTWLWVYQVLHLQ